MDAFSVILILSIISLSLAIAYLVTSMKPLLIAARVVGGVVVFSILFDALISQWQ